MDNQSFNCRSKPVVLLLQDDPVHGPLVRMILNMSGVHTMLATTEEEAREAVKSNLPQIILADWDMDGLDGREIAARVKQDVIPLARAPVVLMTDFEINEWTRRELLSEDVRWVLRKPVVVTSLPRLIERTVADCRRYAADGRHAWHSGRRIIDCGTSASSALLEAVV